MAEQGPNHGLAAGLLRWYGRHARSLPWRAPGSRRPNPYHVWLSEIMLQQTTVAAVIPYFQKFTARWPGIGDLAAASLDDVLAAWAGLGYYARARNLHACAKTIAGKFGGQFPENEDGLLALPGIGPYTAAAIAAIAFGRSAAAVDGNVERVISRLDAIETPLSQAKSAITSRVLDLVPAMRPGDFAQALMDLGATVCTPRTPRCELCPWTLACKAKARGMAEILPRKAAKKKAPVRFGHVFWLERSDGTVLLRRRPEIGLLGGMLEFPGSEWMEGARRSPNGSAPADISWKRIPGSVQHTFTHFKLELIVHQGMINSPSGGLWLHPEISPPPRSPQSCARLHGM
ncbi:MAG: A/G-specific adenine glycosylase [Rhizobiales bacterium]|nr:A/G-specific adenine glycosylase [Hyphomicrobiales bacterium]